MNGIKRKRTREQAGAQHLSLRNSTEGDYLHHQRRNHSHHPQSHQGSRAPIGPEDKVNLILWSYLHLNIHTVCTCMHVWFPKIFVCDIEKNKIR